MESIIQNRLKSRIDDLLDKEYFDDETGKSKTGAELIAIALFQKALNGDIKAFLTIRDTIGQAPPVNIITADVDPDIAEEVERLIYSAEKENENEE